MEGVPLVLILIVIGELTKVFNPIKSIFSPVSATWLALKNVISEDFLSILNEAVV